MKENKKNIFDTEIEMIDLDSIGDFDFRYEEFGSPNQELGDDLTMVMKETQVFSADEIEKALEKNMHEEIELDLDQTKVIDPVEVIEGYLSEDEVAETIDEEVFGEAEITPGIKEVSRTNEKARETAAYDSPVGARTLDESEYGEKYEEFDDEEAEYEEEESEAYEESADEEVEYEEPETDEDIEEAEYEEESAEYEEDEDVEDEDEAEYEEETEEEEEPEIKGKAAAAAPVKKKSNKLEKLEEDESYEFENEDPKREAKKSNTNKSKNTNKKAAAVSKKGNKKKKKNKKSKEDSESRFGFVEAMGIAVAVILIVLLGVLGYKLLSDKTHKNDVEQFASIGALYSNIDGIGNEGITAIGNKAYIDSITPAEEVTDPEDNNDEEPDKEVKEEVAPVSVNFSSIEKDLKIKFINKNTNKLITGVRFEVTAKGPNGKTYDWVDEDKDGVIYVDKLDPGNYEVKVVSVDPYEFPETATTVKVQDTVVYQVINVIDEAVDMSQVNLAQEENQGKDVDQGESLKDTVKLVDTTATPVDGLEGFVKINKSDIKDPKTLVKAYDWGGFRRVDNVAVTDIALSGPTEVNVGESININAQVSPAEATDKTVTWTSSDESVAAVDQAGNVFGISGGSATIIVKSNDGSGVSKTWNVNVKEATPPGPKKVEGVKIEGSRDILVGEKLALSAKITPKDAEDKGITWTSDDESIVRIIDQDGTVQGMSAGSTMITAMANDGSGAFDSVTINVDEERNKTILVSDIKISGETEVSVGSSIRLKAAISPDDASDKTVNWKSSDPDIAMVDSKGNVSGYRAGRVTITAEAVDGSGVSDSIAIDVKNANTLKLTILDSDGREITEKKAIVVGETYQIIPVVDGYTSTGDVTYSSSNNAVTVSDQGLVTGVTVGSADITITTKEKAADGNPLSKVVSFTVKDDPSKNTTNALMYTKDGVDYQIYYKTADGKYVEAKWADYYTHDEFYIKGNVEYKYTGWQEINGNVYYFTEDGNKVTGEQIIGGVKYNFASDGTLVKGNGTRGIDVSTYNGTIDWNKVKNSGISFVIIRCGFRGYTKGGLILDSKYKSYIQGATAAGLKVGLYLFSQAVNEAEAVEEASLCVNLAQGYKISYPIFIDSEYANGSHSGRADKLDKATRTAVCKAFCETIKSAGYTPGVYASKSWLNDKLDASQLSSYKIWMAHYTGQTDYTGKYDIWQHSAKGSVNGISGNVDLNISYLGY